MTVAISGRDLFPAGPPRIVHENEDFMILDKPAHLLCHPTRLDGQETLITWLRTQRPGDYLTLLNRLDRETSGLCMVAKHPAAATSVNRLIEKRLIDKDYFVIVWGVMQADYLEIDAQLKEIGVTPENPVRIKQGVTHEGVTAHTKVWRLANKSGFSLLRAQPKTGRLHQIRAHLSAIGLPVVGDKIYGPDARLFLKFIEEGWTEEHQSRLLLPRQALHASQLTFMWHGQTFTVQSGLPPDLQKFWDDLP